MGFRPFSGTVKEKICELPGTLLPGPPPGRCPGPDGGLKASPKPPAVFDGASSVISFLVIV